MFAPNSPGKKVEDRRSKETNEKNTENTKKTKNIKTTKKHKTKMGQSGKVICWNKGNSTFLAKKPEVEQMIDVHQPLIMGILEANMGENCFESALERRV